MAGTRLGRVLLTTLLVKKGTSGKGITERKIVMTQNTITDGKES
jgi:hypothetical protein